MPPALLVSLTRGGRVESSHLGHWAVWHDGRIVRSGGEPSEPFFFRSAAKPIQAMAAVESGAVDRFRMSERELALVVGSHSGSPEHARTAAKILEKAGQDLILLRCGGHTPLSRTVDERYLREGYTPGRLEDNCSGKHAGMIAAAVAWGADPARYADPDHDVQRWNLGNTALYTGVPESEIGTGTDGCGVPSFAVPVEAMARAAAVAANPELLPDEKAPAAERVLEAAVSHPDMVAGTGRFDTRMMEAGGGRLLAKSGAEGVQIVGVRGERMGIAVKVQDGAGRARQTFTAALLRELGILGADDVGIYHPRSVLTREGLPAGEFRVHL